MNIPLIKEEIRRLVANDQPFLAVRKLRELQGLQQTALLLEELTEVSTRLREFETRVVLEEIDREERNSLQVELYEAILAMVDQFDDYETGSFSKVKAPRQPAVFNRVIISFITGLNHYFLAGWNHFRISR